MSGVQRPTFSVVEFTSLPQNLRTTQIRKKFDKDGSGFLEAKNAQGQNEIYMLEQAMGLDLSKYKRASSKVEITTSDTGDIDYHPFKTSTLYGSNGKPSVVINGQVPNKSFVNSEYIERKEINGNKTTTQTYIGLNLELDKETSSETVTKNASYGNVKGLTKTETKDDDGGTSVSYERGSYYSRDTDEYVTSDYYRLNIYKDQNGKTTGYSSEVAGKNAGGDTYYVKGSYKYHNDETLFNDKKYGKLAKHTDITGKTDTDPNNQKGNFEKTTVHYTLNGEKAEVKKSKNGRYEITQKGKTNVYSHDGKNLKMSYVMADTIKLENGYQKKVSPNGKETWYYAPNGKATSQAQYHVSVAKNIKVRNGKFIYNNQELPAKLNKNGSYTVTVGKENIVLKKVKKH